MTTTRTAVQASIFAAVQRAAAALPDARAVLEPEKPVEIDETETVLTVFPPEGDAPLETLGRHPPFYQIDRINVEVVVSGTDHAARFDAALAVLDTEFSADRRLAGTVKGLLWSAEGSTVVDVGSASVQREGEVEVTVEYESATRLAV